MMTLTILVGLGKFVDEYIKATGVEVVRFPESGKHYTEYPDVVYGLYGGGKDVCIYTHSLEFIGECVFQMRDEIGIRVIRCEGVRVFLIDGERVKRMLERDMEFR